MGDSVGLVTETCISGVDIRIQFKHRFQVFRCFSKCSLENQCAPVDVCVLIER